MVYQSIYINRFFVSYVLLLDVAFWESGRCINEKVDVSYLRIVYMEIDAPYLIDGLDNTMILLCQVQYFLGILGRYVLSGS